MSLHSIRKHRRTHVVVGLTALIGLVGVAPAMSAPTTTNAEAPSASAPVTVPSDVTPLKVKTSLLGVHHWYQQVQDGYPVVGGLYAQHVATKGEDAGQVVVWDGRVSVGALDSTDATVTCRRRDRRSRGLHAGHAADVRRAQALGAPRRAGAPGLEASPP